MTTIAAVIARVKVRKTLERGANVKGECVALSTRDRDALLAHIDAQAAALAEAEQSESELKMAADDLDLKIEAQAARIDALEGALTDVLTTRGIPRREEYLSECGLQGAIDAHKRACALLTPEKTDAE